MGLTINMCHDVEKYEESVVGGFGIKKFLYIVLGVIIGAATMAVSHFVLHIHILISVYLMVPVVVLVIAKGFYGKGRISFIKGIFQMMNKSKPLTYQSTETLSVKVVAEKKEGTDGKKETSEFKFSKHKPRNK